MVWFVAACVCAPVMGQGGRGAGGSTGGGTGTAETQKSAEGRPGGTASTRAAAGKSTAARKTERAKSDAAGIRGFSAERANKQRELEAKLQRVPTGESAEALPMQAADAMAEPAAEAAAAMEPAEGMADADGLAAEELPASDASAPADPTYPPLGAIGYDSEGRQGRIHIVVRGDTLWDISNAYLGTPWVWPSIWNDNGEIENPHRIYPGDGVAPMKQIIRYLHSTGFKGALSLELFNKEYWKQDASLVAKTGLEKMRAVVNNALQE